MIIGIDLDEILSNFMNSLIRYHNEKYNTELTRNHFNDYRLWLTWGGTEEETKLKLDDFYTTDYFENIQPVSGSVEAVDTLKRDNRLLIITSRPLHTNSETINWLDRFFPNAFSGIYFTNKHRKKSEICTNLNINLLIEDSLEYALECSSDHINILLFDCPWNQSEEIKNITRVYSWKGILDNILNH